MSTAASQFHIKQPNRKFVQMKDIERVKRQMSASVEVAPEEANFVMRSSLEAYESDYQFGFVRTFDNREGP